MKMFKEGNVEIPYENNHFDNEEDYYFSNDGGIKHFQD